MESYEDGVLAEQLAIVPTFGAVLNRSETLTLIEEGAFGLPIDLESK